MDAEVGAAPALTQNAGNHSHMAKRVLRWARVVLVDFAHMHGHGVCLCMWRVYRLYVVAVQGVKRTGTLTCRNALGHSPAEAHWNTHLQKHTGTLWQAPFWQDGGRSTASFSSRMMKITTTAAMLQMHCRLFQLGQPVRRHHSRPSRKQLRKHVRNYKAHSE